MIEQTLELIDLLRKELEPLTLKRRHASNSGLYTLNLPLHLDPIPVVGSLPRPFLVWARPDRQHYRFGVGTALEVTTGGQERFQHLKHFFDNIAASWRWESMAETASRPGAFCAFAFDGEDKMSGPWQGVANSLIAVPEVLLEFREARYTLSLSCQTDRLQAPGMQVERWMNRTAALLTSLLSAGIQQEHANTLYQAPSEPPNSEWLRLVAMAREAIRNERMVKVVPARHVRIRATRPFNESAILERLARDYPTCLLLGLSLGGKTLIAATPERLVSLENGNISCDALGGTTERSGHPVQDNLLAHRLLQDPKTRHEHALVVDHLRQALHRLSAHVSVPDTPSVLPLGRLQHLWTPIKAEYPGGISLLDLAAALHPTPAVAGTPVPVAKAWLARHEPFQRGWYTGSVGWLQPDGNGELVVLLRSALLADTQADLYAGAGIVADSDPKQELAETELKLGGVIRALTNERGDAEAQHVARP